MKKSKPGNDNNLITIGSDGFLKIFDLKEKSVLKSFKICDFCLSVIVPIKNEEIFAVYIYLLLILCINKIGSWASKIHLFNINYGSIS